MSNQEVLNEIVVRSTQQLFDAYGLALAYGDGASPAASESERVYAGIVGFTGDRMRGSLVLAPCSSLLLRSQSTDTSARDWTAELANQLLGRIKNQLLGCSLEIYVTTPVVIHGLQLSPVPRHELLPYRFHAACGDVTVWFDAEIADGVVLQPGQLTVPSEGDAFLF